MTRKVRRQLVFVVMVGSGLMVSACLPPSSGAACQPCISYSCRHNVGCSHTSTASVHGLADGASNVLTDVSDNVSANALATSAPTRVAQVEAVLVGAGNIADCSSGGAETTARLLDRLERTVFTLGDNAYLSGTSNLYRRCYDPAWVRYKARTRPAPGNHDYRTANAVAYFAYFGENAGPTDRGYYSYTLGAWHVVSLNSQVVAGPNSEQAQWLGADLAANPARCTLAY
jgi:hypothetical protein